MTESRGIGLFRRGTTTGIAFEFSAHLQKVLGHSTLEMTRRYANLMTEDLQEVHQRLSLLALGSRNL